MAKSTWFHPRACMMPGPNGNPVALMTLQEIGGSDYFGPGSLVDFRRSGQDVERSANRSQHLAGNPVPGRSDGLQAARLRRDAAVSSRNGTVIALGHVVFYKGDYFARKGTACLVIRST